MELFWKNSKTVFELMIDGDKDPQKIVEEKGLKQQVTQSIRSPYR